MEERIEIVSRILDPTTGIRLEGVWEYCIKISCSFSKNKSCGSHVHIRPKHPCPNWRQLLKALLWAVMVIAIAMNKGPCHTCGLQKQLRKQNRWEVQEPSRSIQMDRPWQSNSFRIDPRPEWGSPNGLEPPTSSRQ